MAAEKEINEIASSQTDHSDNILNSIADAIITVNTENEITYVNVAAEQLLGSSSPILRVRTETTPTKDEPQNDNTLHHSRDRRPTPRHSR